MKITVIKAVIIIIMTVLMMIIVTISALMTITVIMSVLKMITRGINENVLFTMQTRMPKYRYTI